MGLLASGFKPPGAEKLSLQVEGASETGRPFRARARSPSLGPAPTLGYEGEVCGT